MTAEKWYSDTENKYRGYQVHIIPDNETADDPRETFEPMGKMICFHRRYNLGDAHNYDAETVIQELAIEAAPGLERTLEAWENEIYEKKAAELGSEKAAALVDAKTAEIVNRVFNHYYLALELYLYDHSGITMSATPFSCPWDSGQVGIMVLTKKQARREYSGESPETAYEKALKYMHGEIRLYDNWLTGDVFGYAIEDPDGETIDSCWGFYGFQENIDHVMQEAKGIIDDDIERRENEAAAEEKRRLEMDKFINNHFAL